MKTTAEEKMLRSLEKAVDSAAKKMTTEDFKDAQQSAHKIAINVIATHRRMIDLWIFMDRRIQRRALQHSTKSKRTASRDPSHRRKVRRMKA